VVGRGLFVAGEVDLGVAGYGAGRAETAACATCTRYVDCGLEEKFLYVLARVETRHFLVLETFE